MFLRGNNIFFLTVVIVVLCIQGAFCHDSGQLFKKISPSVFRIQVAMGQDEPKSMYGSGFSVSGRGLVLTNYHVVAQAINFTDKYNVYVVIEDVPILAEIVAVDVIHDLALLRIDRKFSSYLKIRSGSLDRGEKIFSVGIPMDLNLSIVEGNYNGILKAGMYETILVSSPINPGMSGGATVDSLGQLIGVNVAIVVGANNISFCVPVKFVNNILKQATRPAESREGRKNFHNHIGVQLLELQKRLSNEFYRTAKNRKKFGDWYIPGNPGDFKCWAHNNDDKKGAYLSRTFQCYLSHAVFLDTGIQTGSYEVNFASIETKSINRFQLFDLANRLLEGDYYLNPMLSSDSSSDLLTPNDCDEAIVVNPAGIPIKIYYCMRGYLNYPGLYNFSYKWVTLEKSGKILAARGSFRGFTAENVKKMLSLQLNALEKVIQ